MKKIKDLTLEEMNKICVHHRQGGFVCCENSKCPLLFVGCCLKAFIEKLHYIEREIETNESDND